MRFNVRPIPGGGWKGTITIFTHSSDSVGDIVGADQSITVGAVGDSPADSLMSAASTANRIMSDPTIRALMPPQVQAAIATIKTASAAAKKGRAVAKKVFGFFHHKKKKKAAQAVATISRAQEAHMRNHTGRAVNAAAFAEPQHDPEDDGYVDDEPEPETTDDVDAYADIQEGGATVEPVDPRSETNVDVDVYDQGDDGASVDGDDA